MPDQYYDIMSPIKKEIISFENGREAIAVFPGANASGEQIASALELGYPKGYPKAVLLIIGGAEGVDQNLRPRLLQLFSRGIARAAANVNAVIIDGGTESGVMSMMGQGVADRGYRSRLVGVAPIGQVNYPGSSLAASSDQAPLEPNHSHFVLVKGNAWGAELASMFNLAEEWMTKASGLVVLVNGGSNSKKEALQAVRRKLPLVVVQGSGGLADMITTSLLSKGPISEVDPEISEIIEDGDIRILSLSRPFKEIEAYFVNELDAKNDILTLAWQTFADYDLNAMLQQKTFSRLQNSVLIIGVVGTALTVMMSVFTPRDASGDFVISRYSLWWTVQKVLLIVPILLTLVITAASRFKHGNKWLLLRAGAEAIKQEIYRYRTGSTYYRSVLRALESSSAESSGLDAASSPPSPAYLLSQKLEDITRRTMRSDVSTSGIIPYHPDKGFPPYVAYQGDDGFSRLTGARYVEVRLVDQLDYYLRKGVKLDRQLRILQWAIWVIGGVATFLALVHQETWIALTTSLVAALTSYLSYKRTEDTLTKYNEAKTDLANVRLWWSALSAEAQAKPENVDLLVENTEAVLKSELDGWVQLKPDLLSELRKDNKLPERQATSAAVEVDADRRT